VTTHYALAFSAVRPSRDPGVEHAIIVTRCGLVATGDAFATHVDGIDSTDCPACLARHRTSDPRTFAIWHLRAGVVLTSAYASGSVVAHG
jgi:hypothetical protein